MRVFLFAFGLSMGTIMGFPFVGPFSIVVGLWLGLTLVDQSRGGLKAAGGSGMTRMDMCRGILGSRGIATDGLSAADCETVLRSNARGGYIGYTEYNRAQARRDAATRSF